ncbi:hypothetical protein [Neopusillimonas aromaticivorans]|uniref:hypothetical protein n=1 Tax=Neopusillimonas aromaticivorans TaxID=2979868 RepID=UPI003315BB5E
MTKELTPSHHFEVALGAAESDPVLDKKAAKEQIADLRVTLLKAQYALLKQAHQSVLIVIAGLDGVGKGGCINMLNEWMDPRHIITLAYGPPGPELQGCLRYGVIGVTCRLKGLPVLCSGRGIAIFSKSWHRKHPMKAGSGPWHRKCANSSPS